MALFEVTPYDRQIYERELRDFLPRRMIDIHTHVWLDSLVKEKGEFRAVTWPTLVAADNSIEDLQETYRLMFPDKEVGAMFFGSSKKNSMDAINDYVAQCGKKSGFPTLYYSTPQEPPEELERKIRAGGFLGLKSFLNLAPAYIPENEIRIFDFFPKNQLKKMDEMGAMVMLHIPRSGRLKDPVNLHQIVELKKEFPRIGLIIAHIGRAYCENDIGNAFEFLAQCPDLMFDFSANCCDAAMEALLRAVGPKRVMFGSDLPILRMRTRRIVENNTYINLIPPGLYGDVSGDPHMREVSAAEAEKITFFMYEELRAFKRVAQKLRLSKDDIEDIFYNNAGGMITRAKKNIYG